jgi:hypothetical protein
MVSNSKSAGDSTIYLLSHEEAEWDFTGEKITMSADELEVPYKYLINTGRLDISDTLSIGGGGYLIGEELYTDIVFPDHSRIGNSGEKLYMYAMNGVTAGASFELYKDTAVFLTNVDHVVYFTPNGMFYHDDYEQTNDRWVPDMGTVKNLIHDSIAANGGGGSGSIDTIKSTTPANLTENSYTHAVVYNSSTGRLHIADTTSSATFVGDVTFEGDVYMDALIKSDTTWIMVTPDGKLIPGDSISFASQGLTDKLVPIEKYLSDVVDGELLWTWYDHTGRPWTIRGTGGTSPDKALNALTWQAEHLLRYNLALEKKVNGLIGLVVLLAGVIVIYGFIIIRRK